MTSDGGYSGSSSARDLSARGQRAALWFRHLARAVKSARLYRGRNAIVDQLRDQLWQQITEMVREQGGWRLRITATEIRLDDEVIVRAPQRVPGKDDVAGGPEEKLPFLFFGDGIRSITFTTELKQREFEALFEALVAVGKGRNSQDDIVTLLWQANLGSMFVESVPLEQTIYLSSHRPRSDGTGDFRGQTFAWAASGSEIRADLGQMAGAQGLHRDTFDDWRLPDVHAHSAQAYQALQPQIEASRARFMEAWQAEQSIPWTAMAPPLLRATLALSPAEDTRTALTHSVVSWVADALQRSSWEETEAALALLREIDPERRRSDPRLLEALEHLDGDVIAEQLDEAEPEDHARFAALMVGIGIPGIGLTCTVMSQCTRQRPRAAATTALCYICGDQPQLLERWLLDRRWYVVRNVVFVLGQIGGSEIVDLLRLAAQHEEPRVRREVVKSLGNVSRAERTPVLIQQLASRDPQLLAASLNMLTRERNPRVVKAILQRIEARDFLDLTEDNQRAFLSALAEVADDDLVPALEGLLNRDAGWFAMRTIVRDSAARLLARIGTPRAKAVLDAGLRSRTEAVRLACMDALGGKKAA